MLKTVKDLNNLQILLMQLKHRLSFLSITTKILLARPIVNFTMVNSVFRSLQHKSSTCMLFLESILKNGIKTQNFKSFYPIYV
jgi:hypothetical protein